MLIFHSYVSLPEGKILDPGNCGRWWKMHMPSWDYDMDYEPLTGMPIGIVVALNICYYVLPLGKKGGYPSTPLVINQRIWKGYQDIYHSSSVHLRWVGKAALNWNEEFCCKPTSHQEPTQNHWRFKAVCFSRMSQTYPNIKCSCLSDVIQHNYIYPRHFQKMLPSNSDPCQEECGNPNTTGTFSPKHGSVCTEDGQTSDTRHQAQG